MNRRNELQSAYENGIISADERDAALLADGIPVTDIRDGDSVTVGSHRGTAERVRDHDAWVELPGIGASWVPLANVRRC